MNWHLDPQPSASTPLEEIRAIVHELFVLAAATLLALALAEELLAGVITNFLDLKLLLLMTLVVGAASVIFGGPPRGEPATGVGHNRRWLTAAVAGVVTSGFVWLQTGSFGWLTVPMSVLAGVIVALLLITLETDA